MDLDFKELLYNAFSLDRIKHFFLSYIPRPQDALSRAIFSNIRNYPYTEISLDAFETQILSLPATKRKELPQVKSMVDKKLVKVEAQEISAAYQIYGSQINNLLSPYNSAQDITNDILSRLVGQLQNSKNALCLQSLSGNIDYPISNSSDRYKLDYGSIPKMSPNAISLSSITEKSHLIELFDNMINHMMSNNTGINPLFLLGKNVYKKFIDIITDNYSKWDIGGTDLKVLIFAGFYQIYNGSFSYHHPDGAKSIVPDNFIYVVDLAGMHTLNYLKLDYVPKDGIVPLSNGSIFSIIKEELKYYEIILASKPVPVINPYAILHQEFS